METKRAILVLMVVVLFVACQQQKKPVFNDLHEASVEDLLLTDKEFAQESEKIGFKGAFLEFIDSNGVILKPNAMPMIGADAIEYILMVSSEDFKYFWEPQKAIVSKGNDIGYTYGIYRMEDNNYDTAILGNYVTVWRRQFDGSWKFVLHSSNEGLGNLEQE